MFDKAKKSLHSGYTISNKIKLLILAAHTSRPSIHRFTNFLLKKVSRQNRIRLKLKVPGRKNTFLEVFIRNEHLESDYLGVCELILFNCYRIPLPIMPDIIIDGGGNTGLFTLLSNKLYPETITLLFEPVDHNIAIIKDHLHINKATCAIHKGIITTTEGELPFYLRNANNSSFDGDQPYEKIIAVQSFSLYERLRNINFNTALIKLDIEGAETEVIPELLSKFHLKNLHIVGELHQWPLHLESLKRIAHSFNYELLTFNEDDSCLLFHIYPNGGMVIKGSA